MRIVLTVLCAALVTTVPALAQTAGTATPALAPGAAANAMVSPAPVTTSQPAAAGTASSNPNPNHMNAAAHGARHRSWWGLIGLIGLVGLAGRGGNSRTRLR